MFCSCRQCNACQTRATPAGTGEKSQNVRVATRSVEVKNIPDWKEGEEGGREETPAAPAGREAFVLGDDDAAATEEDFVYA